MDIKHKKQVKVNDVKKVAKMVRKGVKKTTKNKQKIRQVNGKHTVQQVQNTVVSAEKLQFFERKLRKLTVFKGNKCKHMAKLLKIPENHWDQWGGWWPYTRVSRTQPGFFLSGFRILFYLSFYLSLSFSIFYSTYL